MRRDCRPQKQARFLTPFPTLQGMRKDLGPGVSLSSLFKLKGHTNVCGVYIFLSAFLKNKKKVNNKTGKLLVSTFNRMPIVIMITEILPQKHNFLVVQGYRTGETAQSVEYLLHKHTDLDSDPQSLSKRTSALGVGNRHSLEAHRQTT